MAHEPSREGNWVGFRQCINKLTALDQTDEGTRIGSMQGNGWIYECLCAFRKIAAAYLREIADDFTP